MPTQMIAKDCSLLVIALPFRISALIHGRDGSQCWALCTVLSPQLCKVVGLLPFVALYRCEDSPQPLCLAPMEARPSRPGVAGQPREGWLWAVSPISRAIPPPRHLPTNSVPEGTRSL